MEYPCHVGLFSTCLVDQFLPQVGVAAVKVLRRASCQVDYPAEQTCCGQPFFNSGFRHRAANLAMRTIEIFEPCEAVVLPSGSCTTMIRHEYPLLLAESPEWQERAKSLAAKTFELSEFLVHKLNWQPTASEDATGEVTYHDSCHMCRTLGIRDEPRHLLSSCGVSLHEMSEPDRCCGFGGLFSLRLPEVSNAMTAEKLRQAAATEARMLVTADPGCLLQMRGLASDDGPTIQHLASLIEELTR